ncbi:MAG: DUF5317 family protein [Candidatus Omnitrophota bacterium]|nr:DUF5317 family protein [Candidatus Omnitrophota bacterium]
MKFIKYLEKINIITREELWILASFAFFYSLSCVFFNYNLHWFGWSFLIIAIGGMANLYVIDYNNLSMPILPRKGESPTEICQLNPNRRLCILNSKTKLKWLADIFHIGKTYYSLGDFLIYIGAASMVLSLIISFAGKII